MSPENNLPTEESSPEINTPTPIEISGTTTQVVHVKKSKKPMFIALLVILVILIGFSILTAKEYLRANKFSDSIHKLQSQPYFKNLHTYLEYGQGEYVNYRTCNVTSTNALWNFEQPEKGYYIDFGQFYYGLEGTLRGEQSDIKKGIPAEYKKNFFTDFAAPGLEKAEQKRQAILDLTSSMEVLFNSNEHISYCERTIYRDLIERLSDVEINASGANTVVSGGRTEADKKRVEEMIKALEDQSIPVGFETAHQGFVTTLKAISQTYTDVNKTPNTSESVKRFRAEFKTHQDNLDKNLKDLAAAGKQKINVQPASLSALLQKIEK